MDNFNEQELAEMLHKLDQKIKRYNKQYGETTWWRKQDKQSKQWDDWSLFQSMALFDEEKNTVVSVQEFNNIFKDKKQHGFNMLQNALKRNYVYNINKRYKQSIVDLLEKMGLKTESEKVANLSMKDFIRHHKQGKWNNVYELYGSAGEDIDAVMQSPSDVIDENLNEVAEKIRINVAEVLGY